MQLSKLAAGLLVEVHTRVRARMAALSKPGKGVSFSGSSGALCARASQVNTTRASAVASGKLLRCFDGKAPEELL
jgi:hypothetical protein